MTFKKKPYTGRILVACEHSGRVRDAFAAKGWLAWSCDLEKSDRPGNHHRGDVRELLNEGWDLLIAFPPCTYLCASGIHHTLRGKRDWQHTADALAFVEQLLKAPVPHIAVENPVGILNTCLRPADQMIHPWQYGHFEEKRTCLWLKRLPLLQPSRILRKEPWMTWANRDLQGRNRDASLNGRAKRRALTYHGIAEAMAAQWTEYYLNR